MLNKHLVLKFSLFCLTASMLFAPIPCHPEERIITAEATYTMGDGETPAFAEAMVLQKAKQSALEQAGTYVQSYTKMHNMELTADEITTIAGGVLRTDVLKLDRSFVGNVLRFDIAIKAVVTTDRVEELAKKLRGRDVAQEFKQLQVQYAALMREMESLKAALANTPSGPERDGALEKLRDREKNFRLLQSNESKFFKKLVSGESLYAYAQSQVSKKESDKQVIDEMFAKILREGSDISLGEPEVKASLQDTSSVVLTIPVTIKASPSAKTALIEAARRMNGKVAEAKYEGNKVTAVRLGDDPELIDYVMKKVSSLRMVLEIGASDLKPMGCEVFGYKTRTIGTGKIDDSSWFGPFMEPSFSDSYAKYELRKNEGFIFAKEFPLSFSVELQVPVEIAKQLSSVTGRMSDKWILLYPSCHGHGL